jgi:L-ascorbate metabolism protein UlaG (beta-lactamase superfamily)
MSIKIKWFPPAWVQIKLSNQKVIYIDPAYLKKYYRNYPKKVEFSSWPDPIDGLPEKDLEKADVILVTHHHKDHCKGVTTNRLRGKYTSVIATKDCLKELGKDIAVIGPGEEIEVNDIKIKAVHSYNIRQDNKTKIAHKKGVGVGYLINTKGIIIYHAGDTDLIPEMAGLGRIDIALLPIGGRDFTMGPAEAVEACLRLKPKVVIPMHHFEADPLGFKKQVEKTSATKVAALHIGEVYRFR